MTPPVTLVTGARKGIGRYLAEHYCAMGHIVYGCSRGEADWGADGYTHLIADIAEERDAKQVFGRVRREQGRLDNLLNNAGIASMNHSLLTPVSTLDKILRTNVIGCFTFCREGAKLMKKNSYGRIVNFSTVAVPLKLAGEAAYVASKAAVESLTDVLSREFAEFGITVNTIGPVPIQTDLIRSVPGDKIDAIVARQAIKRLGEFADVANITDFYLRPESGFVTGQHIYLGGV
ncbi:MAG: SDR family oxidoreductase [Proteobacteria bacterium]|nr:SDR family oxidoreductase [Pseudomonadota bacterium]